MNHWLTYWTAPRGGARRWLVASLALSALTWAAWTHLIGAIVVQLLQYNDFARFYASAQSWSDGGSLYAVTWATPRLFRGQWIAFANLNPPHFELLIWPLTRLSLSHAYGVWAALNIAGFLGAAAIVVRRLHVRLSGWSLALAVGGALTLTPVTGWTSSAQVTGLVAILFAWIWLEIDKENWNIGAIGIGIAWSLKLLFLPLVVWLLWRRQFRAAGISLALGIACFLVGVAVFGWAEHLAWARALASVHWGWYPVNTSLSAIGARAAYVWDHEAVNPAGLALMTRLGMLASVPFAIIGSWRAANDPDRSRGWLLMLLTCLLCFPVAWIEYWVILAPPAIACWRSRALRTATVSAAPAWWVQSSAIYPYPSLLWAVTIGSLYTWCLLAWWVGAVGAATDHAKRAISES